MCLPDRSDDKTEIRCCCGMNCAHCLIYRATAREDDTLRVKAQTYYRNELGCDLPLEDFSCRGVFSDKVFRLCRECPCVRCCEQHGVAACEACERYPCPEIREYLARYVEPYLALCSKQDEK